MGGASLWLCIQCISLCMIGMVVASTTTTLDITTTSTPPTTIFRSSCLNITIDVNTSTDCQDNSGLYTDRFDVVTSPLSCSFVVSDTLEIQTYSFSAEIDPLGLSWSDNWEKVVFRHPDGTLDEFNPNGTNSGDVFRFNSTLSTLFKGLSTAGVWHVHFHNDANVTSPLVVTDLDIDIIVAPECILATTIPPDNDKKTGEVAAIIGGVIGGVVLIIILMVAIYYWRSAHSAGYTPLKYMT